MFDILGKFKICEPATRQREQANFLANYLVGRAVDFTDSSGFTFNTAVNEFSLSGIAFNSVAAVDKYGLQENFEFPSVGLRRKEMSWSSSPFPVTINTTQNGGFDLFGTYIGIKKISTTTSLSVYFSSLSMITGWLDSYVSGTGEFTFKYDTLPAVYTELDGNSVNRFSITSEVDWAIGTYDSTSITNTAIGTPYGSTILSKEKYKEINATVSSFDTVTKTITGTLPTGLTVAELRNMQSMSPRNQIVRIVPLGFYTIADNALEVPIATSIDGMPTRGALGLTSYLYYGIPYHTGNTYTNTSRDYYVRTPVFDVDFSGGGDLFMCAVVVEKKTTSRINPNGFRMGAI